ncbi:MAG: elongation factor 1-beta [Nanoarchaeota archaeon]
MGSVNVRIKIMPSSPSTNLNKIKDEARKVLEKEGGKGSMFEEEPIAFGLKAIIITFLYPEEKELESVEMHLAKIQEVNSVQIIDMRRAL